MADNYLEKQYEDYQAKKAAWEWERKYGKKNKKAVPKQPEPVLPPHPDDADFIEEDRFFLHIRMMRTSLRKKRRKNVSREPGRTDAL